MICESADLGALKGPLEIAIDTLAPDVSLADLNHCKLNHRDLQMGKKLGAGAFGDVFQATVKGREVAVKKLGEDLQFEEKLEVFNAFRREVWLSNSLRHPTIVNMIGWCSSPYCIVLEFIGGGHLGEMLRNTSRPITWSLRFRIAIDIADALMYLHNRSPKIIHRDLKSPNILIASLAENAPVVCKLTDFGESLSVATKASGREKLANPAWCAPEVMKGNPYTESADIFSLGIVLWELLTRSLPYSEYPVSKSRFVAPFEDAITQGLRPTIPSDCPPSYAQLIRQCWHSGPDMRPTAKAVWERLNRLANNPNVNRSKATQVPSKVAQGPPQRPHHPPHPQRSPQSHHPPQRPHHPQDRKSVV